MVNTVILMSDPNRDTIAGRKQPLEKAAGLTYFNAYSVQRLQNQDPVDYRASSGNRSMRLDK